MQRSSLSLLRRHGVAASRCAFSATAENTNFRGNNAAKPPLPSDPDYQSKRKEWAKRYWVGAAGKRKEGGDIEGERRRREEEEEGSGGRGERRRREEEEEGKGGGTSKKRKKREKNQEEDKKGRISGKNEEHQDG